MRRVVKKTYFNWDMSLLPNPRKRRLCTWDCRTKLWAGVLFLLGLVLAFEISDLTQPSASGSSVSVQRLVSQTLFAGKLESGLQATVSSPAFGHLITALCFRKRHYNNKNYLLNFFNFCLVCPDLKRRPIQVDGFRVTGHSRAMSVHSSYGRGKSHPQCPPSPQCNPW